MPSYDAARYDPPAPIALVTLRNPATGTTITDQALLMDTGADATLLPRAAVEQLGVPPLPDQRYELMGFDGNKSWVSVAVVDAIFLNRRFRGRYLLIDADQGILGRGVLNHLAVLLDGPGRQMVRAYVISCVST